MRTSLNISKIFFHITFYTSRYDQVRSLLRIHPYFCQSGAICCLAFKTDFVLLNHTGKQTLKHLSLFLLNFFIMVSEYFSFCTNFTIYSLCLILIIPVSFLPHILLSSYYYYYISFTICFFYHNKIIRHNILKYRN